MAQEEATLVVQLQVFHGILGADVGAGHLLAASTDREPENPEADRCLSPGLPCLPSKLEALSIDVPTDPLEFG